MLPKELSGYHLRTSKVLHLKYLSLWMFLYYILIYLIFEGWIHTRPTVGRRYDLFIECRWSYGSMQDWSGYGKPTISTSSKSPWDSRSKLFIILSNMGPERCLPNEAVIKVVFTKSFLYNYYTYVNKFVFVFEFYLFFT